MKILSFALGVGFAAAIATTASADIEELDTDADGLVSETEYEADTDRRSFDGYDEDGDGAVSEAEYRKGNFKRYDRDGDGNLDEDEREAYDSDEDRFEEED